MNSLAEQLPQGFLKFSESCISKSREQITMRLEHPICNFFESRSDGIHGKFLSSLFRITPPDHAHNLRNPFHGHLLNFRHYLLSVHPVTLARPLPKFNHHSHAL